jgi:hypothetical protein
MPKPKLDREVIEKAAEEAERAARRAIEGRLGVRLGDYGVVVKVREDSNGVIRVSVDINVTASKTVPREVVDAIIEDAIEKARKAFEEVALRRGRRGERGSRAPEGGR